MCLSFGKLWKTVVKQQLTVCDRDAPSASKSGERWENHRQYENISFILYLYCI